MDVTKIRESMAEQGWMIRKQQSAVISHGCCVLGL